jgi:hypothetical protein
LTKLISDNITNEDEHLPIALFLYINIYKVVIGYTPYPLVYGLHPFMPTKYIMVVLGGNERDNILVKVLTSRIIKLKKLQEARM